MTRRDVMVSLLAGAGVLSLRALDAPAQKATGDRRRRAARWVKVWSDALDHAAHNDRARRQALARLKSAKRTLARLEASR